MPAKVVPMKKLRNLLGDLVEVLLDPRGKMITLRFGMIGRWDVDADNEVGANLGTDVVPVPDFVGIGADFRRKVEALGAGYWYLEMERPGEVT